MAFRDKTIIILQWDANNIGIVRKMYMQNGCSRCVIPHLCDKSIVNRRDDVDDNDGVFRAIATQPKMMMVCERPLKSG